MFGWLKDRKQKDPWGLIVADRREVEQKAAGISCVALVCHPDVWDFVLRLDPRPGEKIDVPIERLDGHLVRVQISGPLLVQILASTWDAWLHPTKRQDWTRAEQSIASRIYEGISDVVRHARPGTAGSRAGVPDIVLDDSIPTDGSGSHPSA